MHWIKCKHLLNQVHAKYPYPLYYTRKYLLQPPPLLRPTHGINALFQINVSTPLILFWNTVCMFAWYLALESN